MRDEKKYSEMKDVVRCNNRRKTGAAIIYALLLSVFIAFTSGTASGGTAYTTYTYDNLNRITKVVYVSGKSIAYTYDAAGNQTAVVSGSDSGGTTTISLPNSGFESGKVNWTATAAVLTNDAAYSHTGSWYAWLGGSYSATDYIYQDVVIPSDAQQSYLLQFWYSIATAETTTTAVYDTMAVEIRKPADNSLLSTLVTLSNLNKTNGYVQSPQYDLSAYRGQTIRLKFTSTTNATGNTNFRVDDISFTSTQGSSNQSVSLVGTNPSSNSSYSTIQAAYNANTATSGSTIKAQGVTLTENLVFNQNNSIALTGGYDSTFTTIGATMTTVHGSLTISGGTVTVANIVIQ